MKGIILLVVLGLALGACGGSTTSRPNTADEVRKAEAQALTAITSDNPEDACQYYTVASHDDCLKGILMMKAMDIKPSSLYPSDWQSRLDKATVTITGDKATVSPIMGDDDPKPTQLAKVNGRWLID